MENKNWWDDPKYHDPDMETTDSPALIAEAARRERIRLAGVVEGMKDAWLNISWDDALDAVLDELKKDV